VCWVCSGDFVVDRVLLPPESIERVRQECDKGFGVLLVWDD